MADKKPRNARFWIWWATDSGPVKVTLKPGQSIERYHKQSTEEGWQSEWEKWTHEEDCLHYESESDGRDCDGRLSQSHEAYCALDQLMAGEACPLDPSVTWPAWENVKRSQRDYAAEAMGY